MNLADLNPRWVGAGGPGITQNGQPVPARHGVGISFDCPCGGKDGCLGRCYIPLNNPLDGGPSVEPRMGGGWTRTGADFDHLTVEPSIQRVGGCSWHGWIRAGKVISC